MLVKCRASEEASPLLRPNLICGVSVHPAFHTPLQTFTRSCLYRARELDGEKVVRSYFVLMFRFDAQKNTSLGMMYVREYLNSTTISAMLRMGYNHKAS